MGNTGEKTTVNLWPPTQMSSDPETEVYPRDQSSAIILIKLKAHELNKVA